MGLDIIMLRSAVGGSRDPPVPPWLRACITGRVDGISTCHVQLPILDIILMLMTATASRSTTAHGLPRKSNIRLVRLYSS